MIPVFFDVKTSLVLMAVLGVAGALAWRRRRKLLEAYETRLVPWESVAVLLWACGLLVAMQLVEQLPALLK